MLIPTRTESTAYSKAKARSRDNKKTKKESEKWRELIRRSRGKELVGTAGTRTTLFIFNFQHATSRLLHILYIFCDLTYCFKSQIVMSLKWNISIKLVCCKNRNATYNMVAQWQVTTDKADSYANIFKKIKYYL